MDKEIYSKWLEHARKNTNVESISKAFEDNGMVFKNIPFNKEQEKRNKLFNLLEKQGFPYEDIEDLLSEYGGTISEIYAELGIKIGATMEMERLRKQKL